MSKPDNNSDKILKIKDLTMCFGGLVAVDNISFEVNSGEILSIIGPNGAGKSTLFNVISGIYTATSGEVYLKDKPIKKYESHEICTLGMARTFQNIRLFKELNVFENVICAQHSRTEAGLIDAVFRRKKSEREKVKERAYDLLKEFGLERLWNQASNNLPYGAQRRLEMVRALATDPSVLLLDEPAAGLNPHEIEELVGMIRKINKQGLTILFVEHRMNLVMNISDRIIVLNHGKKIAEGKPEDIQNDPAVIKAYLGTEVKNNA